MRIFVTVFLVIFYVFPIAVFSEHQQKLLRSDFTTWPRAHVSEFGCFLEKEFGHKDKKFNCSQKKYINKGDPCKNTEEYYEGPEISQALSTKVDPKIESIHLSWEHGDLQNVSITLKRKYSEKELRESFKLPHGASIQECSKINTCIVLNGFDHMGAGDVDCGEQ